VQGSKGFGVRGVNTNHVIEIFLLGTELEGGRREGGREGENDGY
jgi:hypothetical protein